MANYINTLQEAVKEHHGDKERAVETINCFRKYLQSPKFWDDTTIQVAEVAELLHNIETELDLGYCPVTAQLKARTEPACIQRIQA